MDIQKRVSTSITACFEIANSKLRKYITSDDRRAKFMWERKHRSEDLSLLWKTLGSFCGDFFCWKPQIWKVMLPFVTCKPILQTKRGIGLPEKSSFHINTAINEILCVLQQNFKESLSKMHLSAKSSSTGETPKEQLDKEEN